MKFIVPRQTIQNVSFVILNLYGIFFPFFFLMSGDGNQKLRKAPFLAKIMLAGLEILLSKRSC